MAVKQFGHQIAVDSTPLTGALAGTWQAAVIGNLFELDRSKTGKCVLSTINAGHKTVTILPYIDTTDMKNATTGATSGVDAYYKGRPVRGGDYGIHLPAYGTGTGKGSAVQITFTPWRWTSSGNRAVTLLHELVHAAEDAAGTMYCNPMGSDFDTQADFDTIMVENIYRSEKGIASRKNHHGWDPLTGQMVTQNSAYRKYVASFRSRLPTMASKLAHVDVPFNPFRQGANGYIKL